MRIEKDPDFIGFCMNNRTLFDIWVDYMHGQPLIPAPYVDERAEQDQEREMLIRMVKALAKEPARCTG
jgi:hypothetical protein